MKTKLELIIMCGLPRAGKSSWIQKNKKNCIVVSPDEIRKEIFGHQFHSEANKFVFSIAEAMAILLLKQGKSVIIDATNITENARMSYYPIARKFNASVKIVWVYISEDKSENLKECLIRNAKSPDGERLPEDALTRMSAFFETPYCFDKNWYKVIKYRNV